MVAAAAILTAFLVTAPGRAQQPDVFEVLIPAAVLDTPAGDGTLLGDALGTITAFSGRNECVDADTTSGQEVVLRLGEPGQPPACGVAGAIVTFVNARCHQLATKFVLRPGERKVLDNVAPLPPDEQPQDCIPNPDAGFGPFFDLVVSLDALNEPVGFNDPLIKNFGQFIGGLTAYADAVKCVREEATARNNDLTLRLGHPDQPAVCAEEGAHVIVIDDHCRKLVAEFTLVLDADELLALAVAPPGTPLPVDCEPMELQPAGPTPTATSPGVITPPDTGNGGLLP